MINKTPLGHIKELAEFISLQYDTKNTPLGIIAGKENLQVFYDSYEIGTFDGMTIYTEGLFYVHLNTDNGNREDSDRGRFTLAHELGHYFIDTHRIGLKSGLLEPHPSRTNMKQFYAIEREADYFASCLLMPEKRFKQDVFRKKFSFELIEQLCKEYRVSKTACAFRFAELGNHPIMIVFAKAGKIKWTHNSAGFPFKWLLGNGNVPPNTVMGEYFQNGTGDVFKTEQVWAMDWFNYTKDEDTGRKFFEHCITYKDSALSLIWEN